MEQENTDLSPEKENKDFMAEIYKNEDFIKEREANEKQIMESAHSQAENKNCLDEMDAVLKDLQQWKEKRNVDGQKQEKKSAGVST